MDCASEKRHSDLRLPRGRVMPEVLYLLLGWLLGLFGPRIVDHIRSHYDRRHLGVAIRTEALGIQKRLAATSFRLGQSYGDMSRAYLVWLKKKLSDPSQREEPATVVASINTMLLLPEAEYVAAVAQERAKPGSALGLKRFTSSFIDANVLSLNRFPTTYQSLVHEFRNQLDILNQEIEMAMAFHRMTFDSSLNAANHAAVNSELTKRYIDIQKVCIRAADKLQEIIDFDVQQL